MKLQFKVPLRLPTYQLKLLLETPDFPPLNPLFCDLVPYAWAKETTLLPLLVLYHS